MFLLFVLLSLPFLVLLLIRYAVDSKSNHSQERAIIVKQSGVFGLTLGGCFMVLSLFGNVIHLPPALETIIDFVFIPVFLGVTVLAFALSGYRVARQTGHLRAATLAGLLTGLLAFILLGLSFTIIDMVFFDIVRQQPEKLFNFAQSGYQDMRAYLFDSTVRGALIITPVGSALGTLLGSVGGWIGTRKKIPRQVM